MHTIEDSMIDPAITSTEAAKLLGVSVSTAQIWMESGVLDSWKTPGGHRRTRRSAVLNLLGRISSTLSNEVQKISAADDGVSFPLLANESRRLDVLAQSGLLDGPDPAFDRMTRIASQLLGTPISLITLLTGEDQWFKSRQGLDIPKTPRSWAFCNYTVMQDDVFMVADAKEDARFMNNPLVLAPPYSRFYAGVPLLHLGVPLGSLCVIDCEPRILRSIERQMLKDLGAMAMDLIAWRWQEKNDKDRLS